MIHTKILLVASAMIMAVGTTSAQEKPSGKLTYIQDVGPIVKKYCLPCHLAENENPSGLALDNFETLMKGGEHGNTVVPGKPNESNLYLKLLPNPPFGKQMARNRRRLTEEEVKTIFNWIEQGAKK
ncbi:MAG: hypothetical protein A2X67_06495 [Ignavibacteria bacterium GWA2_55_11]|nr:MAG: hypothetical protein A2X67_06495 [Ignavibacteria bacterium GWA2_55_11]OGU47339.1 MAG: hypothetical protein A2X68_03805 [Ignavibacteria bacterium GWC2_56_12]OGU74007.1 MAG: hypothetical protein A3H45_15270 [Ignavibacteria bacterium RIFCSPLOWO2_02_FULL_55_14]OGU75524.1 MAG: hypothetical protein A3G43_14215 [Ignavibacteria bacterium RIFCSPLOWO2_12_FULL_56_21]HAV22468.1 hypothetical protein [Bacteroidota bacterium]